MKVCFFDKYLRKNFFTIVGKIVIITNILFVFITISEDHKFCIGIIFVIALILIYIILLCRANITKKIKLRINGLNIEIYFGDLFKSDGLKLITFNEYFDTLVDNEIIAENTLNGIFITNNYPNVDELDNQISRKLNNTIPISTNTLRKKGKKKRYKLGTTIEVEKKYLLTAFTHFDEKNLAYLSKSEYLLCLDNIWKEINRIYAGRDVCIPLLGSGISRIGKDIKHQEYLELILCTLKISDIDHANNSKISIVIHKNEKEKINLFELKSKF
jgi:hypothetical protein